VTIVLFYFLKLYDYIYINHLADAFIQSDLQLKTIEADKLTIGQQYASAMTLIESHLIADTCN